MDGFLSGAMKAAEEALRFGHPASYAWCVNHPAVAAAAAAATAAATAAAAAISRKAATEAAELLQRRAGDAEHKEESLISCCY